MIFNLVWLLVVNRVLEFFRFGDRWESVIEFFLNFKVVGVVIFLMLYVRGSRLFE